MDKYERPTYAVDCRLCDARQCVQAVTARDAHAALNRLGWMMDSTFKPSFYCPKCKGESNA